MRAPEAALLVLAWLLTAALVRADGHSWRLSAAVATIAIGAAFIFAAAGGFV